VNNICQILPDFKKICMGFLFTFTTPAVAV